MTLPWVKHPSNLRVIVRTMPRELRASFYVMFEMARRDEPWIGYVLSDSCDPLGPRDLAPEFGVDHRTAAQHIFRLRKSTHIYGDMLGRLLVPLVLQTELDFAPSANQRHFPADDTSPPRHLPPTGPPARSSDFFQETLIPVEHSPPDGDAAAARNRATAAPPHPLKSLDQTNLDVRPDDVVENLGTTYFEHVDGASALISQVPPTVGNPTSRYLIAKLALQSDAWMKLLTAKRERALLGRLSAISPAGLFAALEQASHEPEKAKNAGAWLWTTARALEAAAAGQEVAS